MKHVYFRPVIGVITPFMNFLRLDDDDDDDVVVVVVVVVVVYIGVKAEMLTPEQKDCRPILCLENPHVGLVHLQE